MSPAPSDSIDKIAPSAVWHPGRGARSIGIGHPQSGDRCIEIHLYHPRPLEGRRAGSPSQHPARVSHYQAYQVDLRCRLVSIGTVSI